MLRAMTGIAVGGCLPLLFSLCGDLFSHKTRAKVASFLTIHGGPNPRSATASGAVGPEVRVEGAVCRERGAGGVFRVFDVDVSR